MAKSIRKKFVRSDITLGQMRIQPRDVALLKDLASYRFLNTEQILALHPGGRRNTLKRLSWLYHSGFVERPETQKLATLPTSYLVYELGRKGAELFMSERDIKTWVKHKAKIASPNFAHALMVSQFRVVLTLALQTQGGVISRWRQGYDLKDELTLSGRSPAIVPDGFFTIKLGGKQWHFFLEADRGSMDHHRFLAKMRAYWKWFAEKTYNDHLHFQSFRVLTITDTGGRRDNLCAATKNADARRTGSGLFLFACEKDYSLTEPRAVLNPIWLSPKSEAKHSLLDK